MSSPPESALTDCCLSYKQCAPVSPLFATLTNSAHLIESAHFETPCFDTLAHSFPVSPLVATLTKNTRDGGTLLSVPGFASIFGLGVEPMLDVRLEEAQRDGALLQHGIVEGTDAELSGEAALGFGAQFADFELAEFVGQRLPGPHDVAIHLNRNVLIGLAGVVLEKLDGLLARPAHRVHASVDHEAHGAPHFVAELPELRVRIGVEANVFAEALAVERPAFDERGVTGVLAKLRRIFHLLRQRN